LFADIFSFLYQVVDKTSAFAKHHNNLGAAPHRNLSRWENDQSAKETLSGAVVRRLRRRAAKVFWLVIGSIYA
jgi:hypothetical protein